MSAFPLTTLRQIVQGCTDFEVIYADQNAPRPAKPYATIRLTSTVGIQHSEYGDSDDADNRLVTDNQTAMIDLNFFGPSALSEASKVRNRLQFETTLDGFYAGNLALQDRGTVTNLSALLNANTQFEQRAMFEIMVGWRSVETENVGRIEKVQVQGTLELYGPDAPPVSAVKEVAVTIGIG